jgi:hypothetical protein
MSSFTKLSPMASYYIRRLVQSQKEVILQAGSDPTLLDVLLLEPEDMLQRLALSDTERSQRTNNLEILARAYQSLVTDGQHPGEVSEIEKQLLATLGLPTGMPVSQEPPDLNSSPVRKAITVDRATEILKGILGIGSKYLGPRIARDYFIAAWPESIPMKDFILEEGNRLSPNRPKADILSEQELEDIQLWVKTYTKKCSAIIHGFHKFMDKTHLEELSISRKEL